ncbi:hypothetical protein HMPREF3167_02550 [Trueperella sp. HMSC08B05]|nr:hypothetical protein HMPREF3167_02550 [Trueperella sp. HMSC08B05]
MTHQAHTRARHLSTGRPVTREGQQIWSLHQCLIGATNALERELSGTIWHDHSREYGDYVRTLLSTVNNLVMDIELGQ